MEAHIGTAIRQIGEHQALLRELGDTDFDVLVALLVGKARPDCAAEAADIGNEVIQRHKSTAEMALLSAVLPS